MHTNTHGLSVVRLTKTVGRRVLWKDLTFHVPPGNMVAVTGPSGCGKSSLLNCIGLLDRPSGGTVFMDGREVTSIREWHRRRIFKLQLGFLFQNFGLVENWTIRQNLDVALHRSSLREVERQRSRREALEAVGVGASESTRVHILSGGEQQRVAFARLLLKKPRLVIADEPTAALDPANARIVTDLLFGLRRTGASVVVSTHDERVAASADRVIQLSPHRGDDGLTTPTAPNESVQR